MRTIFIVGTAYSGSTALSREFARDSRIDMMGEIDRLSVFHQWSGYTEHHLEDRCHVCYVGGREDECPVFDEGLLIDAGDGALGARYAAVRRRFAAPIALDGSKNPWWMRSVVTATPELPSAALILTRLPWAFAHSLKDADGTELVGGAMMWRDIYQGVLRIIADLGIPSMVLRYEDFLLNRRSGDAALARLFGFPPEKSRPPAVGLHHAIGGDLGGFLGMHGLDEAALPRTVSGPVREGAYDNAGGAFRLEIPELRSDELILMERWRGRLSADDVASVLRTPGVWETANLLGYDLIQHLQRG